MSLLPRTRLCHSPERLASKDEAANSDASTTAMSADPELHYPFYHQRGRRRRRSPAPYHDGAAAVPFSLAMTAASEAAPGAALMPQPRDYGYPRPRPRPRSRHHTLSGSSGTFRGRRRHRSPSLGAAAAVAAAVRHASSRPHTPSPSSVSSMRVSRPPSPQDRWGSWLRSVSRGGGSRGGGGSSSSKDYDAPLAGGAGVESPPSPRRKILRATVDIDHGALHYHPQQQHASAHRHRAKTLRRSHCPSRSVSVDGRHEDGTKADADLAMTALRRRRRQRTRSRPRPHKVVSGDGAGGGGSGVFGVVAYYTYDDAAAAKVHAADRPGEATTTSSRLQFQVLLADGSDPSTDGDAMDVETG